jgi:hypothetical protein
VPIGTPVDAITVGFNPYVAEPSEGQDFYTPPPVITPPVTPGGPGDGGEMKGGGMEHGGGGSTPAPEPNYEIAMGIGLILMSMRLAVTARRR